MCTYIKIELNKKKNSKKQLMSKFKIDINGKFYNQNLTGVQKFGHEIVTQIDNLLSTYDSNLEFRV